MKYISDPKGFECEGDCSINHIHVLESCVGPFGVLDDSKKTLEPSCFRKIDETSNLRRRKKWKLMFESLPL
jgi:hypothetical protein